MLAKHISVLRKYVGCLHVGLWAGEQDPRTRTRPVPVNTSLYLVNGRLVQFVLYFTKETPSQSR
jgi:hypothetical protein